MVTFSPERLLTILEQAKDKQILVVGDLMIDRYLWGTVNRISPEAPVPIINIEDEEIRFGGAANVANNIIALSARPVLVGTVGENHMGDVFRQMLRDRQLTADGLISDSSRPTTIKTRIIGNNQQIARVDREKAHAISESIHQKLLGFISGVIPSIDAIVLEDYNKGLMIPQLVEDIIRLANRHGKAVTVDPKFDNFLSYRNVTLFKPNKKEAEEALAMRLLTDEDVRAAGKKLLSKLDAEAVLITLGARGMALFERNGDVTFSETRARKVADVSGAGDTVIATVTYALCGGATMKEAVSLANFAAGVVCGEVGVVPIDTNQLVQAVLGTSA